MCCRRAAPTRLTPFSYFWTCWKLTPSLSPSSACEIFCSTRRSRMRLPSSMSGKPDIEPGKRIPPRRVEQKISQAELGAKLGVSIQQVQKYEKCVNRVGAARLQQIATALDVPVTFFYDGDGKAREVESLLFLDSAFSLRLLRAYSKIKDQTVQRQLVSLMESIAANED